MKNAVQMITYFYDLVVCTECSSYRHHQPLHGILIITKSVPYSIDTHYTVCVSLSVAKHLHAKI